MTTKELIVKLLDTDLDSVVDLRKTVGEVEFKPVIVGKWLHTEPHKAKCSICSCKVNVSMTKQFKYCFNCGAKMRWDSDT